MNKFISLKSLLRSAVLLILITCAHSASASTLVSGPLTGNTTWTKADSPYVVSNVTIPAGSTLTIEPGVVVKMSPHLFFYVFGTVNARGTAAEPIIFTAITDDSVGGDSNGDLGATLPNPGDWLSLYFIEGSQGTFVNTEIRYGGASNGATPMGALHNQGGTLALTDCTITDILNYPIAQESGTITLTASTIERGGSGLRMTDGVFALSGNTFTDTLISIDPRVDFINHGNNTGTKGFSFGGQTAANLSGTMTHDQTWVPDGLPYVVADTLTVPALHSLTILPGTTVHMTMHYLMVSGTLTSGVSGASGRVTFTSPSATPQPGDWLGINFLSGSHGAFHASDLRYGAHSFGFGYFNGMVMNQGGTITMDDTTLTDAGDAAIHHESGTLAITASTIANAPLGIRVWGGTVELHDSSVHDLSAYGVYNIGTTAVDATNNWWGAIGGPTHPSNPFGGGVRVSDNVDFGQWLIYEPLGTCMINCNSSVLFLPGMMGSRLYDDTGYEAWLPEYAGDALLRLPMKPSGESVYNISVGDMIDKAYLTSPIYDSFIAQMDELYAQRKIRSWAAVPYDWRLDYDTLLSNGRELSDGRISYLIPPDVGHDPFIVETLKALASSSPTGKVTIIAHSNGGLLAKALTNKLGEEAAQLVDKIVFVDVPQLGTPKALAGLLHGSRMGLPESFPLLFTEKEARYLGQNMPLVYNLLPSFEYFHYVDDSVLDIEADTLPSWAAAYGTTTHSTERLKNFVLDMKSIRTKPTPDNLGTPEIGNSTLFAKAVSTHNTLDNWIPPQGVQLITVAGWGEETLSGIGYKNVRSCASSLGFFCLAYADELTITLNHVIDGDGTVVEPSQHWANGATSTRYWVNLSDYNDLLKKVTFSTRKHADILEVPTLEDLLKNILIGTSTQLNYITMSAPAYDGKSPRLHFTLHSPLTLGFLDSLGNYSGSTATSTLLNVPGVRYERYGDVQWLSIPKELSGQLILQGTGSGSFTLDVEEVNGNETLSHTSFEGIPSATSTMATMEIVPTQSVTSSSTLVVDYDGNGVADRSLKAQENGVVFLSAPKLPLTLTADNNTIILGSATPAFTVTLSGFQGGDTATSSVTGTPLCTTTAISGSPVGIYPISCTIGTLASIKYDVTTFAAGTLTILYKWTGFSQPINDTVYNPSQSMSVFKGGSTVPVKFQLKNANNTPVQASSAPLFLTPQRGSAMSAAVDESTYGDPATTGTAFRYDSTAQQYVYNWSTKGLQAGYWYKLSAKLEDGTIWSVTVGVR